MAQLAARDLYELLHAGPAWRDRVKDGVRLVYNGTTITLATADAPDTVIAQETSTGRPIGPWELTAHSASIQTMCAWLRSVDPGMQVGISPFWGPGGPVQVVFTSAAGQMCFPVIDCPSAPVR